MSDVQEAMHPELRYQKRPVDPSRLDLVREFYADPLGRRSPELQELLLTLRAEPIERKLVILRDQTADTWEVARLDGQRGTLPRRLPGCCFACREEAERTIFRLRWEHCTGVALTEPNLRPGG